jgi:hypothetical protein
LGEKLLLVKVCTIMSAVILSLTHLYSSRRWPATRHSTAVKTQMDTTVALLPPVLATVVIPSHDPNVIFSFTLFH